MIDPRRFRDPNVTADGSRRARFVRPGLNAPVRAVAGFPCAAHRRRTQTPVPTKTSIRSWVERAMNLRQFRTCTMVLTGVFAIAVPAASNPLGVAPDLERAGWNVLAFPGKAETRFVGRPDGVIEVTAENSVALLYHGATPAQARKRYLSWRWRVDQTMPPTDLSLKGYDDRPLAVHVWFPYEPDRLGWWQRLTRATIAPIVGVPVFGRVLIYVWGGTGVRGDTLVNPYTGPDGVMFILRPGNAPTGRWFDEKVDIAADFERAFDYPAPAPTFIAVSADADDTKSRSVALIADITFIDG